MAIVGRDSIHLIYKTIDRSKGGLSSMTRNLKSALGQSAKLSKSLATMGGKKILSGIRSVAGALGAMSGALGVIGTGGALATLTALSLRGQEVAASYDRYALSLGGTAEQIQRITSVSSANLEDTLEALKNLQERVGEGVTEQDSGIAEAFAGIGITPQELEELAGADIETVFLRFSDAIAGSSDNATALFRNMELLGDEGFRILSTMAKGSETLRRETELLSEAFGTVVDDDKLQKLRDFRKSQELLKKVFTSLSVEVGAVFAPILENAITTVLAFIKANGGVGGVVSKAFDIAGRAVDSIRGIFNLAVESAGEFGAETASVAAGVSGSFDFVARNIARVNKLMTALIVGTAEAVFAAQKLGAIASNPIDSNNRNTLLSQIESDRQAFLDLGRDRFAELNETIESNSGEEILSEYASVVDRIRAIGGDVDSALRVLEADTGKRLAELNTSLERAITDGAGDAVEDAINEQIAALKTAADLEREEIKLRPPGFTFDTDEARAEVEVLLAELKQITADAVNSVGGALGQGRNVDVANERAGFIEQFTAEKDAANEAKTAIKDLNEAAITRLNQQSEIPEIAAGPGAQARELFALEEIDTAALLTPLEAGFDRIRTLFDEDFGIAVSIRSGLGEIDEIFAAEVREIQTSVDIKPEERQRLLDQAASLRDQAQEQLKTDAELVITARIESFDQSLSGASSLLGAIDTGQQVGLNSDIEALQSRASQITEIRNALTQAIRDQDQAEIDSQKAKLDSLVGLQNQELKLAKAKFEANKKTQIALSIVNTIAAGVEAFRSAPWPANFGALAAVLATGYQQVSAIRATSFQSASGLSAATGSSAVDGASGSSSGITSNQVAQDTSTSRQTSVNATLIVEPGIYTSDMVVDIFDQYFEAVGDGVSGSAQVA